MAYTIRVPTEADTYLLTTDLARMASDISAALDDLDSKIGGTPTTGSTGTFSIVTATSSTKAPILYINSSGTPGLFNVPDPKIINNATDGFGLVSGGMSGTSPIRFTTKDNVKWVTDAAIEVPDISFNPLPAYQIPTQTLTGVNYNNYVVNFDTLYRMIYSLDRRYPEKTITENTLDSHGNSIGTLNTNMSTAQSDIVGKANRYNNNSDLVYYSTWSLGVRTQDNVHRNISAGMYPIPTSPELYLAGNASTGTPHKVFHGVGGSNNPLIFTNVMHDEGNVSILVNIQNYDSNYMWINMKNITSTGEHFRIAWLAMSMP